MSNALDFLQSFSNNAASNVSAPVDGLAWLLRKAGVPVPQNPLLGSDWMAQRGLTKPVPQNAASFMGETAGLVTPAGVAVNAAKTARGLLRAGESAQRNALAVGAKGSDMAGDYLARQGLIKPATVWHGSPHKFDKFDSSKIGTGEGAQAYGHGLYLAETPAVADGYRRDLSDLISVDGKTIQQSNRQVGSTGNPSIDDYLMASRGDGYADDRIAHGQQPALVATGQGLQALGRSD